MPRDDCGQDMKRLENGQIRAARRDGCDDGVFGASRHQQEMSNNLKKKKRKEQTECASFSTSFERNGFDVCKADEQTRGEPTKKKIHFCISCIE